MTALTSWFTGFRAGRGGATRSREAVRREGEDRTGRYLRDNDSPLNGHVRERRTNKVLVMVTGCSMLLAVLEAITIAEMIPLYKVVPMMVQFSDKADQVVRIEPPTGRIPGIDILTESNVKDYVKMRNTIGADVNETISRWGGPVHLMSNESVYNVFMNEMKPVYDDLRAGNFTRAIEIKSLLHTNPGYYQVEFTAYDHKQGDGADRHGRRQVDVDRAVASRVREQAHRIRPAHAQPPRVHRHRVLSRQEARVTRPLTLAPPPPHA